MRFDRLRNVTRCARHCRRESVRIAGSVSVNAAFYITSASQTVNFVAVRVRRRAGKRVVCCTRCTRSAACWRRRRCTVLVGVEWSIALSEGCQTGELSPSERTRGPQGPPPQYAITALRSTQVLYCTKRTRDRWLARSTNSCEYRVLVFLPAFYWHRAALNWYYIDTSQELQTIFFRIFTRIGTQVQYWVTQYYLRLKHIRFTSNFSCSRIVCRTWRTILSSAIECYLLEVTCKFTASLQTIIKI